VHGSYADLQSCGIPFCAGARYNVIIPADAPVASAGGPDLLYGPVLFFVPGDQAVQDLDFTIGYRDGYVRTLASGPVGSQHVLTAQDVDSSHRLAAWSVLAPIVAGALGTAGTAACFRRVLRLRRAARGPAPEATR